MKKLLLTLSLVAGSWCLSASAASPRTVEVDVNGLNCSLCSEEMKAKMKSILGAVDIEPRLECGKLYLDMPAGASVNEGVLSATLLTNGFTYGGLHLSKKSMADVRKAAEDAC